MLQTRWEQESWGTTVRTRLMGSMAITDLVPGRVGKVKERPTEFMEPIGKGGKKEGVIHKGKVERHKAAL